MSRRTTPRTPHGAARRGVVLACLASLLALAGCTSAYDLPLPGGAANSGPVFRVTAEFEDVLDLVPQSSVKVDDVTVGSVEKIEVRGWVARVTMRLPMSLKLPDNATAELRQTSLLGEKFIQLAPPATGATGTLSNGDDIPLARTTRNPEVEEVLGALSLLLNGGGVGQLKIIETELNNALRGNTGAIRDLVTQLDTFVGGLDQQKSEIVRAIDNIDKLSGTLAAQKDLIGQALDQIPVGLKVLADQRAQLTRLLKALSDLGAVGTKVIAASKDDSRPTCARSARSSASSPPPATTCRSRSSSSSPTPSPTRRSRSSRATTSTCTSASTPTSATSWATSRPGSASRPARVCRRSRSADAAQPADLPSVPGGTTGGTTGTTGGAGGLTGTLGGVLGGGSAGSAVPSWATLFPTGGPR